VALRCRHRRILNDALFVDLPRSRGVALAYRPETSSRAMQYEAIILRTPQQDGLTQVHSSHQIKHAGKPRRTIPGQRDDLLDALKFVREAHGARVSS
jgi:hypothetical protein